MENSVTIEKMNSEISVLHKENEMLKGENIALQNELEQYANLVATKEKYAVEIRQQLAVTQARLTSLEANPVVKAGRFVKRVLRKVKRVLARIYNLGYRVLRKIYRTFIKRK